MLSTVFKIMNKIQEAIMHIEAHFPPDSQYEDTAKIGKDLMDNTVGNSVGYNNWRDLPDNQLINLAVANLKEGGEHELAYELIWDKNVGGQPEHIARLSS